MNQKFVDTPEAIVDSVKMESMHKMAEALQLYASSHLTHVKACREHEAKVMHRLDQILCGVFFGVALLVFTIAKGQI